MTRWAFVADVHGNWSALQRAVAVAEAHGAERFATLGDLVGRGQPDACVAWAREVTALAVVGNRDLDHLALVAPAHRAWLQALPRRLVAEAFVLTHGDVALDRALCSADGRRGFRRAYAALRALGRQLWFFGHTHRTGVWRKDALDAPPVALPVVDLTLDLRDPAVCYFINVGTTGRPRTGCGPPAIALFDTATAHLEHVPLPRADILGRGRARGAGGEQR